MGKTDEHNASRDGQRGGACVNPTAHGGLLSPMHIEADLALARKGMKALVRTPEGAELFNDSWMSDHPAVFDIFVRAGRLVAEDTFDNQNGGSAEENVNLRRFPVK